MKVEAIRIQFMNNQPVEHFQVAAWRVGLYSFLLSQLLYGCHKEEVAMLMQNELRLVPEKNFLAFDAKLMSIAYLWRQRI